MLSDVLKKIRDLRTRLIHTDALTHAALSSFPSGHTRNSAAVYLTLGLLLAQLSEELGRPDIRMPAELARAASSRIFRSFSFMSPADAFRFEGRA